MPIYLKHKDVIADLENFNSVLIVACPICPQMSLAMQKKTPLFDFFKYGLKTEAFEDYIKSIREPLERKGIRTDVYTTFLPSPLMCLWTDGQRSEFLKHAKDYEAVLVLGCPSATYTVEDALKGTDCKVFQGMKMKGLANATLKFEFPKFEFPLKVNLEMHPMHQSHKIQRQDGTVGAAGESEKDTLAD